MSRATGAGRAPRGSGAFMAPDELRNLPVSVDVVTAGRAFGMGRTRAYQLARRGEFPVRVLRLGNSYRVTRADLLRALGETEQDGARSA
jgi:hypothetical protein